MEEQSAVWGQGTSWLGVQATVRKAMGGGAQKRTAAGDGSPVHRFFAEPGTNPYPIHPGPDELAYSVDWFVYMRGKYCWLVHVNNVYVRGLASQPQPNGGLISIKTCIMAKQF